MTFIIMRSVALTATFYAALALASCGSSDSESGSGSSAESSSAAADAKDGEAMTIYATTGYIADAVKNVAPKAKITTMVGPGGDPHTFQPSTQDIQTIKDSDLVVWNGLHLEARMIDTLEDLGDKQVSVGNKIPKDQLLDWPEEGPDGEKLYDPHIWNSPAIWKDVVNTIAESVSEKDPDNADTYKANAKKYNASIDEATEEAKAKLDKVAKEGRVLISGHDAFNYFGKTYDYEVHATDFVSSEAQLSPAELSELADLIASKKVPSIFLDNQANPQAIKSLQEAVKSKGWDVKVSDQELFADSLGAEPEVDTYLEIVAHNAEAVSKGLGK